MTSTSARERSFVVNPAMLKSGAVLFGLGSVCCAIGSTLTFGALASAARRWVSAMEVSPAKIASHRIDQAKAAALAGAGAWRHNGSAPSGATRRTAAR